MEKSSGRRVSCESGRTHPPRLLNPRSLGHCHCRSLSVTVAHCRSLSVTVAETGAVNRPPVGAGEQKMPGGGVLHAGRRRPITGERRPSCRATAGITGGRCPPRRATAAITGSHPNINNVVQIHLGIIYSGLVVQCIALNHLSRTFTAEQVKSFRSVGMSPRSSQRSSAGVYRSTLRACAV